MLKLVFFFMYLVAGATTFFFFSGNQSDDYRLFYMWLGTLLFEAVFIASLAVVKDFSSMTTGMKLGYLIFNLISPLAEFYTLIFAPGHFDGLVFGSSGHSTILLIHLLVHISGLFLIFGLGSLFFSKD